MNLHGELVQNRRQKRITGKPKTAGEKVAKHDDFISLGGRNLLIEGSAAIARRKESGCLILSDQVGRYFRFAKDKGWRKRLRAFHGNKLFRVIIHIFNILSLISNLSLLTVLRSTSSWVFFRKMSVLSF
jgi:hypothetical protein